MARKNFMGGLDSLIKSTSTEEDSVEEIDHKKEESTQHSNRVVTKTSQVGIREGETRATFIVKEDALEKLKALAFWERKQIKTVVQEALEDYIGKRTNTQIRQAEKAYNESESGRSK